MFRQISVLGIGGYICLCKPAPAEAERNSYQYSQHYVNCKSSHSGYFTNDSKKMNLSFHLPSAYPSEYHPYSHERSGNRKQIVSSDILCQNYIVCTFKRSYEHSNGDTGFVESPKYFPRRHKERYLKHWKANKMLRKKKLDPYKCMINHSVQKVLYDLKVWENFVLLHRCFSSVFQMLICTTGKVGSE